MMNDEGLRVQEAEAEGFRRLAAAAVHWTRVVPAGEVAAMGEVALLHAGPPFDAAEDIPAPVMNSLAMGCVYEGWADDFTQAETMVAEGAVRLIPAQDVGVVVPLAGVVSPSMYLAAVSSGDHSVDDRYVPLHEGLVHATLFGRRDGHLLEHRRWVDGELAEWLHQALREPLPLLDLLAGSLARGDDGHSRTVFGSSALTHALASRGSVPARVETFLAESPAFALNIWMAAASSLLSLLDGIPGSAIVTRAGGNGVSFGIQLSGAAGAWSTIESPRVTGALLADSVEVPALRAVGDSAVIDFLGLGGQTLATATGVREALGSALPQDALERPQQILRVPFRRLGDRPAMVDARRVVVAGCAPLVLLGVLDRAGERGRIGAGVADVPVALFESAVQRVGVAKQEVDQA